jgi:putative endonuclease
MTKHIQTGKWGEQLAGRYLTAKGYVILETNWRHSHWEVDIIAEKDNVLHFIEVKTRRTKKFGLPEDSVGNKKIRHLIHAAEQYLYLNPVWKRIQFNILAISLNGKEPTEYFLIEDIS